MNAPFRLTADTAATAPRVRLLTGEDLNARAAAIDAFVMAHAEGTPFHRPAWLGAVARGTGHAALALVAEMGGEIVGYLPLNEIASVLFGRMLASAGFAVAGGALVLPGIDPAPLLAAAEELALRRSCATVELRGGPLPRGCGGSQTDKSRVGWAIKAQSHAGFVRPLAATHEAELTAIPRKQRAEVRKGLAGDLTVSIGRARHDRVIHHAIYAESVRNLGTPVFPFALFDAVMDAFGEDADILTVWAGGGAPVASVLSLYHNGAVMPYWGGGTYEARKLRANDRMYFELMRHAHRRGCDRFDFGRSKTGSGAYDFKRNWGFEPAPLAYGVWTAPGAPQRDADPTSAAHARRIALWKKLPLPVANTLGPWIARGLG